jgi:hypothetical protein
MKRFIVGLVAAAAFGLIPSSAFATPTKVCVPTHPNQTVDAPESDGECEIGFEGNPFEPYLSVYIGEAGPTGPEGKEGPKGSTGATGATGPEGKSGSNIVARFREKESTTSQTSLTEFHTVSTTGSTWTQTTEEIDESVAGHIQITSPPVSTCQAEHNNARGEVFIRLRLDGNIIAENSESAFALEKSVTQSFGSVIWLEEPTITNTHTLALEMRDNCGTESSSSGGHFAVTLAKLAFIGFR